MRLIDAEALKQKVKDELPAMSNWGEIFIPNVIDSAPTIDAEPVVSALMNTKVSYIAIA